MGKQEWTPGTMIYPVPAVLVSCGSEPDKTNFFTVAWTGTICSDPAMCSISVRKSRYSYDLIKAGMEFTINLTTEDMARAVDWAGVRSGRDYDKWKETGLTASKGVKVSCPYIKEAPLSIECRVKDIINRFIDDTTGAFDMSQARLIAYSHGAYYKLGDQIGRFGWSVKKKV